MDALIVELIHRVEADLAELRSHVHAHASDNVAHAGADHSHEEYATVEAVAALAVATAEVVQEVADDVAEVASEAESGSEDGSEDEDEAEVDEEEGSEADVTEANIEVAPVRPHALHSRIGD